MIKSKYEPYRKLICSNEIPATKIAELIGDGCTAKRIRAARQRFLNPKKYQKNKDTWRRRNPDKIRDACKNYRNPSRKSANNKRNRYTEAEELMILSETETAIEIAKKLGRSVDAICRKRVRLRKKAREVQ